MVMVRNLVKVGNREVKKRYIGNKLIFEDLSDKTEPLSGEEIFFDNADDSVVHVEIDGKSYQEDEPNPDNPSEIHSLNDFDVVSSVGGRNYWVNSLMWDIGNYERIGPYYYYTVSGLKPNTEYTMSINPDIDLDSIPKPTSGNKALRINNKKENPFLNVINVLSDRVETHKRTVTSTEDGVLYILNYALLQAGIGDLNPKGIILKESSVIQDWTPAPEDIQPDDNHPLIDKINLLLDEPLRSVGDVKDRLFRDTDGLWKIERNVGEAQIGASDIASISIGASNNVVITKKIDNIKYYTSSYNAPFRSTHHGKMKGNPANGWGNVENIGTAIINTIGFMWLSVDKKNIDTVEKARNWFEGQKTAGTPITAQYALEIPTIETLDQELQDKLNNLRSFQDSNYVYTMVDKTDVLPGCVAENLKPTLHTTFKSKGWYDYYLKTLLK